MRGRQRSRWASFGSRLSAGDEAAIRARRLDVPTVRLELVLEAANADLQEPRSFRAIAVNLVERAQDVAALDLAERKPGLEHSGNHRRWRGGPARELPGEEVPIGQGVALGEHHRLLQEVLELSDVARPRESHHALERRRRDPRDALAVEGCEALQEVIDQVRDVLDALAERGHLDHEHGDSIVEILAERSLRHGRSQVLVGRGDQADVRSNRFRPADLGELAALDDAQQLGLERRAQLAELVDEQGPGMREREDAFAMLRRAGERALHVTEEVALHQAFGNRRAVERDQRAITARARVVDRARDELLAGAALAVDADVDVTDRDFRDARENLAHLRRLADDAVIGRPDRFK